jgi:hypothetical protein
VGLLPREFLGARLFGAAEFRAVALLGLAGGALAGTLFATVLASAERRSTLSSLSARRMALWGFVAAVSVPLALAAALGIAGWFSAGELVAAGLGFGGLGSGIGAAMAGMTHRAVRSAPDALPARETSTIGAPSART